MNTKKTGSTFRVQTMEKTGIVLIIHFCLFSSVYFKLGSVRLKNGRIRIFYNDYWQDFSDIGKHKLMQHQILNYVHHHHSVAEFNLISS